MISERRGVALEQEFVDQLATVVHNRDEAEALLSRVEFPRASLPDFRDSCTFWHRVAEKIRDGRLVDGMTRLAEEVAARYPGNSCFEAYLAHCRVSVRPDEARPPLPPDEFRRVTPPPFYASDARQRAIEMFGQVVKSAPEDWCSLAIDGLTGTGKSFLVDHLRRSRSEPSAKITLMAHADSNRLLRQICYELGGRALEQDFRRRVALHDPLAVARERSRRPGEESTRALSVEDQHALTSMLNSHRVDTFVDVLTEHRCRRWLLFIDGAEHLKGGGGLDRWILGLLLPQLRCYLPSVRVIFSGQSVWLGGVSEREVRRVKLEPLALPEARVVLRSIGVEDGSLVARVHERTGGLPIRLASYAVLEADPDVDLEELEGLDRTRWIARVYDGLIHRLSEPGLRQVAPELALLDFFDVGLVEAIFGLTMTRERFVELLDSHFIKEIAPGRWRCHDSIREELGGRLSTENPDRCREIHRKAFEAYRARLSDSEQQVGEHWFDGRVDLVVPSLRHASSFDVGCAREFLEDELVWAALGLDGEFLLSIRRACAEHPNLGAEAGRLVLALERAVLAIVALRPAVSDPSVFETLAEATAQRMPDWATARIHSWASFVAGARDDHGRAVDSGERAVTLDPDDDRLWLDLATAQAAAQKPARAERCIAEHRQRNGESPEVLVVEAEVAFLGNDAQRGRAILRDAIFKYPDARAPRMKLARHLWKSGDSSTALELVKSVLSRDPDDTGALRLQLVLLDESEDRETLVEAVGRTPATVAMALDAASRGRQKLDDPAARQVVLADLQQRPETVSRASLMALGERLSIDGALEQVREVGQICVDVYPEMRSHWTQLEAVTLARLDRISEAVAIFEGIDPSEMLLFTPVSLASCYVQQGRVDDARTTLETWRDAHPGIRDEASLHLACMVEDDPSKGLRILRDERGPRARFGRALLLNRQGKTEEAVAELESMVYSDALYDVSRGHALEVWRLLVRLLLERGADSEARAQLDRMLELYPEEPEVIEFAAAMSSEKGDFDEVERITRPWVQAGPILAMKRLAALAKAVLVTTPSAEDILKLLGDNPDRPELIIALERVTSNFTASEFAEAHLGAMAIAPVSVFEVEKLGDQVLMEMPAAERRARVDSYDREHGDLFHGCSALKIAIYDGRLEDAGELTATLRDRFPDMVGAVMWSELAGLIVAGQDDLVAERIAQLSDPSTELDVGHTMLLSIAISRSGTPADVIRFHERVANEDEDFRVMCLIRIAVAQLRLRKHHEVLATVDELEALSPESAEAAEPIRVRALLGLQRVEDAMRALERQLARVRAGSRAEATAHELQGDCLMAQERYPEAEAAFGRALEIRPRHTDARLGLSQCYERQGRWDDAYDAMLVASAEAPELRESLAKRVRRLGARVWAAASDSTNTEPADPAP